MRVDQLQLGQTAEYPVTRRDCPLSRDFHGSVILQLAPSRAPTPTLRAQVAASVHPPSPRELTSVSEPLLQKPSSPTLPFAAENARPAVYHVCVPKTTVFET